VEENIKHQHIFKGNQTICCQIMAKILFSVLHLAIVRNAELLKA